MLDGLKYRRMRSLMGRTFPALGTCVLCVVLSRPGSAATYYVGSISDLTTRINSAVAGDEIVLSNGVYPTSASLGISQAGTAANRILIRAETIGGAEITGTHGFSFNSGAAYVTVQGFKFTHAAAISMGSSANHCRLSRNTIELTIPATNDVSYINISGDDMEVDRNELRNKSTLGEMLDISGSGSQVARLLWVHHNYFHDFVSPGGNGAETIRWGLSGLSLSTGDGLCEYNLFVRCNGENEMISNKSSGNTYRYNTVLDCPGGEISQRHGNDCLYYGNYMRNTAGFRIYGDRHRIYCNYLEANSIGVNMGNGDGDVYNGDPLTSHDRPDDNIVVFNTFINNSTHYQMGGRTSGLGSSNSVVANNIFQGGGTMASISSSAPYTGSWSNNIRWQTSSVGNMPASGYTNVNPLLSTDANGVYHLQAGSPAINAGVGSYDFYGVFSSYPYVSVDMDGQPRDASKDIGADEFSSAPIVAKLLTTNDVGPNSIDSSVRPPAALRWNSTNSPVWDVATTTNWFNLSNNAPDIFVSGDSVWFSEISGIVTNISLDTTVTPLWVTNDSNTRNFTISGSAKISGGASIVKSGSSTLTLATANDFAGSVMVSGGVLKAGNAGALGSAAGATTVTNGGTLDVNGFSFSSELATASGSGSGGQGAIVNTGAQQTSALRNVALSGHVTFGGTGRWDIRAASSSSTNGCSLVSGGQPFKITKVGTNQVSLVAVSVDPSLGDIDVKEGVFAIQTVTSQVGLSTGVITVFPGATLNVWNLNTAPLNKQLILSNNATLWNESGSSIFVGPVTLAVGVTTFNIGGSSVVVSNSVITGPGGFTKIGAGTLALRGNNSYSGSTAINAGSVALIGSGSIGNSSLITIAGGSTFDVSARNDGKLTLGNSQTLGGNGALYGSLLVSAGATVSPGFSIGALTVTNAIVLQGTTFMELDKGNATNDVLLGAANVTYGGTLSLANLSGALTAGDAFRLFYANSYSGAFTNLVPAMPGPGLIWDTVGLTNGTLKIAHANPPTITGIALSGSILTIKGSGGPSNGPFQILSSTNLAAPANLWSVIATNSFSATGEFSTALPISPGAAQCFYRIRL